MALECGSIIPGGDAARVSIQVPSDSGADHGALALYIEGQVQILMCVLVQYHFRIPFWAMVRFSFRFSFRFQGEGRGSDSRSGPVTKGSGE